LRLQLEQLLDERIKEDEKHADLTQRMSTANYNTEALRHGQLHIEAKKKHENQDRSFLESELSKLQEEYEIVNEKCNQV